MSLFFAVPDDHSFDEAHYIYCSAFQNYPKDMFSRKSIKYYYFNVLCHANLMRPTVFLCQSVSCISQLEVYQSMSILTLP